MEIKASLKYLHISPRKVRLVTGLIKGMAVSKAEDQLKYSSKRSAGSVLKLLRSAVADAENNFHLNKDNLYIVNARVDEGPALKRWRARARGTAFPIKKRSSHIFLILKEKVPSKKGKKVKEEKKEVSKIPEKKEETKKGLPVEKKKRKLPLLMKEKTTATAVHKPKMFQRKSF